MSMTPEERLKYGHLMQSVMNDPTLLSREELRDFVGYMEEVDPGIFDELLVLA